ncbi:hypothetical protein [Crossiella cryophila]|uniref:ATP-binding protein n=1 Tax=Crossiella cryophila TaxID=43355 RepID=A0A7W7CE32_9PSEU|nr:hypothetical protein [Crossiella cryophila]MBB4679425.1 hypothetical protein [Crossiella cryophila]
MRMMIASRQVDTLGASGTGPLSPSASQTSAPRPPTPPHQLGELDPQEPFIGRDDELAWLAERIADGNSLVVLSGPAGVGVTSLVLRTAHQHADAFPGGQLYADLGRVGILRGRVILDHVLRGWLRALGTPVDLVDRAVGMEQATELFRSMTAGLELLVVIDNADAESQIEALLPAEPGNLVLAVLPESPARLTDRDRAVHLPLMPLNPASSNTLLTAAIDPERIAGRADYVVELAFLCAGMPLALVLAATTLAEHPDVQVGDVIANLAAFHRDRGNLTTNLSATLAVAATRKLAFDQLSPAQANALCCLAIYPGSVLNSAVAVGATGLLLTAAGELLDTLARSKLLQRNGPDRYRLSASFADLVRQHVHDTWAWSTWSAVLVDCLMVLHHAALDADLVLFPGRQYLFATARLASRSRTRPVYPSRAAARTAMDHLRPNLVAAVVAAVSIGRPALACHLCDAVYGYFLDCGGVAEWIVMLENGVIAARTLDDPAVEAELQWQLATAYLRQGTAAGRRAARERFRSAAELAERVSIDGAGVIQAGQAPAFSHRLPRAGGADLPGPDDRSRRSPAALNDTDPL